MRAPLRKRGRIPIVRHWRCATNKARVRRKGGHPLGKPGRGSGLGPAVDEFLKTWGVIIERLRRKAKVHKSFHAFFRGADDIFVTEPKRGFRLPAAGFSMSFPRPAPHRPAATDHIAIAQAPLRVVIGDLPRAEFAQIQACPGAWRSKGFAGGARSFRGPSIGFQTKGLRPECGFDPVRLRQHGRCDRPRQNTAPATAPGKLKGSACGSGLGSGLRGNRTFKHGNSLISVRGVSRPNQIKARRFQSAHIRKGVML